MISKDMTVNTLDVKKVSDPGSSTASFPTPANTARSSSDSNSVTNTTPDTATPEFSDASDSEHSTDSADKLDIKTNCPSNTDSNKLTKELEEFPDTNPEIIENHSKEVTSALKELEEKAKSLKDKRAREAAINVHKQLCLNWESRYNFANRPLDYLDPNSADSINKKDFKDNIEILKEHRGIIGIIGKILETLGRILHINYLEEKGRNLLQSETETIKKVNKVKSVIGFFNDASDNENNEFPDPIDLSKP